MRTLLVAGFLLAAGSARAAPPEEWARPCAAYLPGLEPLDAAGRKALAEGEARSLVFTLPPR